MSTQPEELMKKAEGKIGRIFFNDYEGAYETFNKAGAAFKAEANFPRAGDAYMRAGDLSVKLENSVDACSAYTESAKMYARSGNSKADAAIKTAVDINVANGRLGQAARLLQNWGETCQELGNNEAAIAAYKRACELFYAEDQKQSVTTCELKIASILAMTKMFAEASKLYEKVGMNYAQSTSKTMAKAHFFNAFLCKCAAVNADNRTEGAANLSSMLDMIQSFDPYFKNTRENDVCLLLVEGLMDENEEKIDDAIRQMDNFRMLDDIKTKCMNHIKDTFSDAK